MAFKTWLFRVNLWIDFNKCRRYFWFVWRKPKSGYWPTATISCWRHCSIRLFSIKHRSAFKCGSKMYSRFLLARNTARFMRFVYFPVVTSCLRCHLYYALHSLHWILHWNETIKFISDDSNRPVPKIAHVFVYGYLCAIMPCQFCSGFFLFYFSKCDLNSLLIVKIACLFFHFII